MVVSFSAQQHEKANFEIELDEFRSSRGGSQRPQCVFTYPGSGVQHAGMGKSLYSELPVFQAAVEKCCSILTDIGGYDVRQVYCASTSDSRVAKEINEPSCSGVCIFVYQYAITELLKSKDIYPDIVFGHSLGEYSAAVTAGALSLKDGLTLVDTRGKLLDSLHSNGAMLIIAADGSSVQKILPNGVAIVAENGPLSTGVAGPTASINRFAEQLEMDGYSVHRIRFNSASHCYLIDPIIPEFSEMLGRLTFQPTKISWFSTYLARFLSAGTLVDKDYWCGQLRNTVHFSTAVKSVADISTSIFVEVGPQNGLSSVIKSIAQSANVVQVSQHANDPRSCVETFNQAAIRLTALLASEYDSTIGLPSIEQAALNDMEYIVLQVWQQHLQQKNIGMNDNFFEIGGHSMLAAKIIADLSEVFSMKLPPNSLIKFPSIESLSNALTEQGRIQAIETAVIAETWRLVYESTEDELAKFIEQ